MIRLSELTVAQALLKVFYCNIWGGWWAAKLELTFILGHFEDREG